MSAHTTLQVARAAALAKLVELTRPSMTDEHIEDALGVLLYDRLYDFSIVPDNMPNDDEFLKGLVP